MLKAYLYIIFSLFVVLSCVEPYNPPQIKNAESLLVVDAQIDGEKGTGTVLLKGTVPLDVSLDTIFDIRATVSVEDEPGNKYFFDYKGQGEYTIEGLDLQYGDKLRLNILTNDEEEYQSEFVEFVETPEIDSVSWKADNEGVQFYVSTHDPEGTSDFYKWEFEETWEFNSAHTSLYYYDVEDSTPKIRDDFYELYICYDNNNSTNILIGTSEKFSEDAIREFPITYVPGSSGKFQRTYSLLVRQRVLSREEYDYWQLLKQNTEDLGGFFDPQPSQIRSNIFNTNKPGEKVLGYFRVESNKEERIFIRITEVPRYPFKSRYDGCYLMVDTVLPGDLPVPGNLIINTVTTFGAVSDYTINTRSCIDCTLVGSNKKPEYWIE